MVRDHHEGRGVKALIYEAYASMAEKLIGEIVADTARLWPVEEVRVKHRVGRLEIGAVAVAIAVSAAHRAEAFEACRFVIEEIKARVPIWKKEFYEDGTAKWTLCGAHVEAMR